MVPSPASSTIAAASLVQNAGTLTTLTDNVTTTAAAGVNLTATNIRLDGLTINASGNGVARFAGAVRLDGATIITTTGSGDITFTSTLDSQANEDNTLQLTGDTGDVLFQAAVGAVTDGELGAITVVSADNFTASSQAAIMDKARRAEWSQRRRTRGANIQPAVSA